MSFNTVLFDLDGTLLDTSEGLFLSLDETVERFGLSLPTPAQKKSIIGPPIDQSLHRIWNLDDEHTAEAADFFRKTYSERYLFKAMPYPGIAELLSKLSEDGWRTGIATYKRNDYAQRLMAATGLAQLCRFSLGSDGRSQTKADIIRLCTDALGCPSPEYCIMVGDTTHDFLGAKKAGTAFIGVTYGFGFKTADEILCLGALAASANAQELGDALQSLRKA